MTKTIYETMAFKEARKLTDRNAIARAFNLEGRIALKLNIDVDDFYGDKGTVVKINHGRYFEKLTLRRYSDQDEMILDGVGHSTISAGFGLADVNELYENSNRVEVKDGDKVVIFCEDKKNKKGCVLTGHLELPKKEYDVIYKGRVVLDKACN